MINMFSNQMRITGLSGALDTDKLVTDLMNVQRKPYDKLFQKKEWVTWQRDEYRNMNKLLDDFDKLLFEKMSRQSVITPKQASSTDDAKVSAQASASAGSISYTINEVTKLATAATKSSTAAITASTTFDANKSLRDMKDQFTGGLTFSDVSTETFTVNGGDATALQLKGKNVQNVSVMVNGTAYTVKDTQDGLGANEVYVNRETGVLKFGEPLVDKANVQVDYQQVEKKSIAVTADGVNFQLGKGGISSVQSILVNGEAYTIKDTADALGAKDVYVDKETGALTFGSPVAKDSKIEASFITEKVNFSLTTANDQGLQTTMSFNLDSTYSLNQVLREVRDSNIGVNAFYDDYSKKIAFTRKETGDFNKTDDEIVLDGDFLTNTLQMQGAVQQGGTNAQLMINGLATERTSNNFELNGITFTLKSEFTTGPVTVTTTNDVDKSFEAIVDFVNKYNEMIGTINEKLTEKRYRNYQPLTNEQRSDMKENDIKLWDEKAKSGVLRGDTILSSGLSQLRMDLYGEVSGLDTNMNQLAEIGIKTTNRYNDRGKLEIDETKLRKALAENSEGVYNLLMADGETTAEQGIIRRMRSTIKDTIRGVEDRAGNSFKTNQQFTLGRNLDEIEKQMDRWQQRLIDIEDRYWRQFTAMEQAIQRANAQSAQFMQSFGGY